MKSAKTKHSYVNAYAEQLVERMCLLALENRAPLCWTSAGTNANFHNSAQGESDCKHAASLGLGRSDWVLASRK